MRITGVSTYPIAIPYRVPWRNRHTEDSGRPMTHLETTILEVHTDEGISGLGEAKGSGRRRADSPTIRAGLDWSRSLCK